MFDTSAPIGFDAPPPSDFGGEAPSAFDAPTPERFGDPIAEGFGSSPSSNAPPSSFDGPASSSDGPPSRFDGPPPYDPDAPFGDTPATVANDSPVPGSSPFRVNRVVAVAAVVLGAVILIGGIVFLTGSNSKNGAAGTGQSGSTLPPLGALTTGPTAPTTLFDPLAPVSTTTTVVVAPCDSTNSIISPDGKDYTPCGGGFKVDFPGRPDTRSYDSAIAVGKVKFVVMSSTQRDTGRPTRFYAAWGDLPKEPTPEEANDAMVALVQTLKGTMGKPTTFQDQPAMSYAGTDQGASLIGVVFVRGAKVFALEAESIVPVAKDLDKFKATFAQL